jgi:hypothetical protein
LIGPAKPQDGAFDFHSQAYDRHSRAFGDERQRLLQLHGSPGRNEVTARHARAMLTHLRAMYQIAKREAQDRTSAAGCAELQVGAAA